MGKRLPAAAASLAARPAACALAREQPVVFGLLRMKWRGTCESIIVRLRDGDELMLSVLPPRSATSPERTDYSRHDRAVPGQHRASWPTWWRA